MPSEGEEHKRIKEIVSKALTENLGNGLKVQKALRHKSVLNTMKYIHTIQNLREDDFEETTATTPEEIRKLGKT